MTSAAERLAIDMIKLPLPDRANLAHLLIESLDSDYDSNVANDWKAVIAKRSQEIKEGKVICRPSLDVVDEIKEKIKNVSS